MKGFNTKLPEFMIGGNGTIPCCGIGTFGLNENDLLNLFGNYKYSNMLLDTAAKYNNERDIATALRNIVINRNDIFITSKISFAQQQSMTVQQALFESLKKLETDYLDLYLIHSPRYDNFVDTWKQLMELQSEKLLRYIGVSNFTEQHLQKIFDCTQKWPEVNQITVNPFVNQETMNLIKFCQERNILVESAAPFGGADRKNEWRGLHTTRNEYLLYLYKLNIVSLPGTKHYKHMLENFNVFQ
jgi:diketogulonate reductase-like aldo/keto reductase